MKYDTVLTIKKINMDVNVEGTACAIKKWLNKLRTHCRGYIVYHKGKLLDKQRSLCGRYSMDHKEYS